MEGKTTESAVLSSADLSEKKLVFIGGVHRSGTTLVAKTLAEHPVASGLTNTGLLEDEGQHVQSVFPNDLDYGGPAEFAFHPEAHFTETSALATPSAGEQLLRDWSRYWDISKDVLVEKSPPNLLKTRLLACLFPEAYFLIVIRHPVATATATKRIVERESKLRHPAQIRHAVRHWLRAYETFLDDSPHLKQGRVLLTRYEDFVGDPRSALDRVWRFLEVPTHPVDTDVREGINRRYFEAWRADRWNLPHAAYRSMIIRRYEARVRRFGYSLADLDAQVTPAPEVRRLL